ncbi:MAG: hypothetical protein OEY33_01550 [Bdellovibrionales bacterium]|nr:hypothetical protein [Bdellovibrionales bacterium]
MKALTEIIVTIALIVGGAKFGKEVISAMRRESLLKVQLGLSNLEVYSRVLTTKKH